LNDVSPSNDQILNEKTWGWYADRPSR